MGEPKKYALMDVGGGINDSARGTSIADNQWANLRNWYPFEKRLRRRPGVEYVTEDAYTERVLSLFAFKKDTGDWTLIAGTEGGFAKKSGSGLVLIPLTPGLVVASNTNPWCIRQRNNTMYAARISGGGLKRVTDDVVMDAGLAAPSTAPTIADGGAGDLTAADYYGVFTYYNSDTGAESDPSPLSAVLSLGASKQITWSGVTVSPDSFVTARRLYRTLPGQQGRYYFVAQINNNSDTTYTTDNVGPDDLGDPASFSNGLPPDNPTWCELFAERLWVTDGRLVYPSEQYLPESFDTTNALEFFTDDGHEIRVLHAFNDKLIVGRTNLIAYITGTDLSSFDRSVLTDKHGCPAPFSMRSANGLLFWYDGANFRISDGAGTDPISDEKIAGLLERIPESRKRHVCAAIYPRLNWYIASIPLDDSTNNVAVVAYNYRDRTWTVLTYAFGSSYAPACFGDFYDEQYGHLLYGAVYDNRVYDFADEDATDDVGTAITCLARTKDFGFDEQNQMKGMRRLGVLCDAVDANMTVRAYRDESATAFKARTVSLADVRPWKRIGLNTMRSLSKTIALELEYAGAPELDIAGLTFELVGFQRGGQPL